MPLVCGVRFKGTNKIYYFAPGEVGNLQVHDYVVVDTARGKELGEVLRATGEVAESDIVGELKPVLRRATPIDLLDAERFHNQEEAALTTFKEQVARVGLPMKVVSAEYSFDGSRLTFFFSSEQRVDFRDLVREIARIFKTRIELRQIGVRDEAKIIGGVGKCGRSLCCATWLTEFYAVSIKMAKQQELPLSPMEISGLCGRLLCCLGYENDHYQEVKARFPKVGKTVTTPAGMGKVFRVSALRETVSIILDSGATLELTAEQLAGTAPITVPGRNGAPGEPEDESPESAAVPGESEEVDQAAQSSTAKGAAIPWGSRDRIRGPSGELPDDAQPALGRSKRPPLRHRAPDAEEQSGTKPDRRPNASDQLGGLERRHGRREKKPSAAAEGELGPAPAEDETQSPGTQRREIRGRRRRPRRAFSAPTDSTDEN